MHEATADASGGLNWCRVDDARHDRKRAYPLSTPATRPALPPPSRAQAVRDVLGREPTRDEAFAVLPRIEWQLALDH
jgi:hypothetical protein